MSQDAGFLLIRTASSLFGERCGPYVGNKGHPAQCSAALGRNIVYSENALKTSGAEKREKSGVWPMSV